MTTSAISGANALSQMWQTSTAQSGNFQAIGENLGLESSSTGSTASTSTTPTPHGHHHHGGSGASSDALNQLMSELDSSQSGNSSAAQQAYASLAQDQSMFGASSGTSASSGAISDGLFSALA